MRNGRYGTAWLLLVTACALAAMVTVGQAGSTSSVAGTVTADGAPVPGAFVGLTGDGQYTAVTASDGTYTVTGVAPGTYDIAAQAPGYAVARATNVTVSGTPLTHDVTLTASGAKFTALGIFGAQIASIVADGKTGVFYASTSVIPQIYRTADWGGTWTQVTLAADDATSGLDGGNVAGGLTTSGFAGELACVVGGTVYSSKDFGVTWHSVGGTPANGGPNGAQLFWGHAGATSVLLSVSDTETRRADMTQASPTFASLGAALLGSGKKMAVGRALDGAYVAVVDGTGSLSVYTLDASSDPLTQVGTSLGGFPASPTFVRFGGGRATGVPPAAVLVYSSTGSAAMATKAASASAFVGGDIATTGISPSCGAGAGAVGAVSPLSADANGAGVVSQCFLQKTGSTLGATTVNGINNNTGLAFDAAYGSAPNFVVIAGDGGRGLVKSVASGVPVIPPGDATAGFNPGAGAQGGVAVNGFNVPVVKDSTFGPAGASQLAAIVSGSGGRLAVASDDGGTTIKTAMQNGGRSVAWWQGASETWLVFGSGGGGPLIAAIADWTAATPPLLGPNVPGTDGTTIGLPGNFDVTALAGVAGAGTLFIGGGTDVDQQGTAGSVVRGTLTAGTPPALGGVTPIASSSITAAVRALAYCPTLGGDTEVLLIATGTSSQAGSPGGGVVRVTGATGGSPSATTVALGGAPGIVNDLRAHCDAGVVYAGTGSNSGGPSGALYRSTDGGSSFSTVSIAGPGVPPNMNVQVVAVNPSDASEVLIAGNSEGFILRTTDGGTNWTVVNDPHAAGGRNFLSEGVGDLEIPPAASALVAGRATVTASKALVGTGGGLYAASVRGAACTADASCNDADACTDDACSGGSCQNARQSGITGAKCEAGKLDDAGLCGSDTVDAKLAALLAKRATKVKKLLTKANGNSRKAPKLLKTVDGLLKTLEKKIAKAVSKHKITGACGDALTARVEAIRGLI